MTKKTFRANGKLLLSGEYVVLDGALALAIPTRYGQQMTVKQGSSEHLHWRSLDDQGQCWFEGEYAIPSGKYISGSDPEVGRRLGDMFAYILSQKANFLADKKGILVETQLDFPREWGLGSSSTLVYNLAEWAGVDAYHLLAETMGGSGYDIACAGAKNPIIYQIQDNQPFSRSASFSPKFKDQLYFVYLGQKQNSRAGIRHYREHAVNQQRAISNVSIITHRMMNATTINEFQHLVKHHEDVVSSVIGLQKVKDERFADYWGQVKSLGAWGGDFVLVTSKASPKDTRKYFKKKGYGVFFRYSEMVLE